MPKKQVTGRCLIPVVLIAEDHQDTRPELMTINTVATWRCECGSRVKIVAETDKDRPVVTIAAACPRCGYQQPIHAHRIYAVIAEKSEPTPQE